MESTTGLILQFSAILLIAGLSFFLRRSLKTFGSAYLALGWLALSFALFCLNLGFLDERSAKPFFALYFFGDYVFGLMLISGCRALADNYKSGAANKFIIPAFALLAFFLSLFADTYDFAFNLHTLILAIFFAVAFHTLKPLPFRCFGWSVMRVALGLLALDFFHYFVIFSLLKSGIKIPLPEVYPAFDPVIDLVLEVMLGFGMVIIQLENVLREVRAVNEQLREAHEKLENIAHVDPLTMAFNRHAFYGFLKKRGDAAEPDISGCVGFFDIDDLKPINDKLGHNIGDLAIRAVVSAIRDLMRAEDLIYRWGGDEFFVIMVSMNSEMARERMSILKNKLPDIDIEGTIYPLTIRVSYGFEDFSDMSDMNQAIKTADEEMYRGKQERKLHRRLSEAQAFLSNDNVMVVAER